MIRHLLLALALAAGVSGAAQAQNAKVVATCGAQALRVNDASSLFIDATGTLCTVAGAGGGGGGATGSVTAPGTSGTTAQAVQGITGGVPLPAFAGQYNSALPTLASGASGYLQVDASGRVILAPSSAVSISNFPGTQAISAASLPLPSGAATSANQSTLITATGAPADTAYAGSGSSSIVAALKGIYNAMIAATPTGSNVIGSTTLRSAGTNRSASVTTTAANLMAANTARQGWKIKNDCAVSVWISFDGTAAATAGSGNIQVPAGAYMSSEPGFVETGAMSAIAASGTCALTAREH